MSGERPRLVVRFQKMPAAAKADRLVWVTGEGAEGAEELPREGVLPLAAIQWVIEQTLGWADGRFGALGAKRVRTNSERTRQSRVLAECLQAELWGGAAPAEVFTERLAKICQRMRVSPPAVDAAEVARIRSALRDFGAAWRPLPPGGFLERRLR